MNKTAKEMFKDLGYEDLYKNNFYIFYVKELKENPEYENDYVHITFQFSNKTFVKSYGDDNSLYEIDMKELQAINKQIEELGWDKGEENE